MVQRFKTARIWLVIGLGILPFTPLPMAVQVGLAVGIVVALMALSSVGRNPGTVGESSGEGGEGGSHAAGPWGSGMVLQGSSSGARDDGPSGSGASSGGHPASHSGNHGHGGGAADSGQAADGGSDGGGGDGGGGGD